MDIRRLIDTTRMSGHQWLIIALAAFLNALDGYDLVAMSFTSTAVAEEFSLTGTQLGWLLAAALLGIGIGAIILAPLADRFGRKKLIVIASLTDLAGLTLSGFASSYSELLTFRVLTGIGVGGILASVTVLVSEYSSLRLRGLAMSIYSAGYGLGASLCGVLATQMIPEYGWRSIFLTGAGLTLLALVLTVLFIPESTDYLASRGRTIQVEAIARRLGKEGPVTVAACSNIAEEGGLKTLVSRRFLATTVKLWAAFSLITFAFNFANQWTPTLLTESGLSAQQGIVGGIMLSFGGTIGSLLYGALTTRLNARRLLMVFSVLSAVVLMVFILSTTLPAIMLAAGVGVGMLLNGCVTGMYTITPQAYPSALRTSGVGTAIGVSRAGAVVAPVIVGYLVDAGWTPLALYTGAAVIVALSSLALIGVREHTEMMAENQEAPKLHDAPAPTAATRS